MEIVATTVLNEKFGINNLKDPSFIKSCNEEVTLEVKESYIHIFQKGFKHGKEYLYRPYPRQILAFSVGDNTKYAVYEAPNRFRLGQYSRYLSDMVHDEDIQDLQKNLIPIGLTLKGMFGKKQEGYVEIPHIGKAKLIPIIDRNSGDSAGSITIKETGIQKSDD